MPHEPKRVSSRKPLPGKRPRDWSLRNANEELVNEIAESCRQLLSENGLIGSLTNAVEYKTPQPALYWSSHYDDLLLIVPTHFKSRDKLTPDEIEDISRNATYSFLRRIVLARLKKRSIRYCFLHIERTDEKFALSMSGERLLDLFDEILASDWQKAKETATWDAIETPNELILISRHRSLGISENHEYRLPLQSISPKIRNATLRKKRFPRIAPHGHVVRINGKSEFIRLPQDRHPAKNRIIQEYRGFAYFLHCSTCSSEMLGFPGEKFCASCDESALKLSDSIPPAHKFPI